MNGDTSLGMARMQTQLPGPLPALRAPSPRTGGARAVGFEGLFIKPWQYNEKVAPAPLTGRGMG